MYKIMIADDEGIVIEAFKFIIEKNFGESCLIESAKTGRSVIELAETFRPDIAFMDIQMPGINGIEAMKEIRKYNKNIIFIIVSAYNKFDYAKEAINIEVLEYINKPIEQTKIVDVLKRAMTLVDTERNKRSNDLKTREKLEIVVPVIETGYIYSVLFQENYKDEIDNYRQLLGFEENCGFMMVVECGDSDGNRLTNQIGSSVKVNSYHPEIRNIIKEYFPVSAVGSMMANKVIVFIPSDRQSEEEEYQSRINTIEQGRKMVRQLHTSVGLHFRMGIGNVTELSEIEISYKEALKSLKYAQGSVVHTADINLTPMFEADYPIQVENAIMDNVREGNISGTSFETSRFFDLMVERYRGMDEDIRLKALELTLFAEHIAYTNGGMTYHFPARHEYLREINSFSDLSEIKTWFVNKTTEVARNVKDKRLESSVSAVEKAKKYIDDNFSRDISLDEVSREVNISPYYFSKIFKNETGTNFIDYLTELRINKAKKLLENKSLSMKEICTEVGYSDPNYFSRTFKKKMGVTPTEYRDRN